MNGSYKNTQNFFLDRMQVVHILIYNIPKQDRSLRYFYKYAFDLERYDVALWIVGRNLVLADAAFSITGNRR